MGLLQVEGTPWPERSDIMQTILNLMRSHRVEDTIASTGIARPQTPDAKPPEGLAYAWSGHIRRQVFKLLSGFGARGMRKGLPC